MHNIDSLKCVFLWSNMPLSFEFLGNYEHKSKFKMKAMVEYFPVLPDVYFINVLIWPNQIKIIKSNILILSSCRHFYHTPCPGYTLSHTWSWIWEQTIKKLSRFCWKYPTNCTEEYHWGDRGHWRERSGREIAVPCPSSCCCKNCTMLLFCSLQSPHHPTAGFSFYVTSNVKHLTSPWRPFKAAPSLQIIYNSQKVSSLSPDRSLMQASTFTC